MDRDEDQLRYHRRDTRTAALLHALLAVGLIVLWLADRRLQILDPLERWILGRLLGPP